MHSYLHHRALICTMHSYLEPVSCCYNCNHATVWLTCIISITKPGLKRVKQQLESLYAARQQIIRVTILILLLTLAAGGLGID